MSKGGSATAVFVAIGANVVITIVKGVGFAITGSGSLLAETVHSVADVGNQALLAYGLKRAAQPADEQHPMGYGREAFVWALVSAVGIFFLGCGVSVAHGVHGLMAEEHEVMSPLVAYGILGFSMLAEGGSGVVALRVAMQHARERNMGLWRHLRTTDDPFEVAILAEDSAALLGVAMAALAIFLSETTHWTGFDGVGSIAIGLLLGGVALFLVRLNRSLLIGRSVAPSDQAVLDRILAEDPAVEAVITRSTVVTGTETWSVSAELDFDGAWFARQYLEQTPATDVHARLDSPEAVETFLAEYTEEMVTRLGDEIDRIEARIREEMPRATHITIETD